MSKGFRHTAPGLLEIRQGGGYLSLFGLPFFAAGVFMILTSLGVVPVSNVNDLGGWGWPALLFMGALFSLVGGALTFGRSWTTVDATQRLVIKELGLLVPMRRETHRLEDYTAVTLGLQEGDSDTADRFPVGLKGRSGQDLQLWSSAQYADARACAAAVAEHLQLELEDASTDHPVRLRGDHSDVPLGERLQPEVREADVPRPSDARSIVTPTPDGAQIVIPKPRLHPAALAFSLIPGAMVLVVVEPLSRFFRQTQTPDPVGWMFLGFLFFGFVFLPLSTILHAFVRSHRGRTIVMASRDGVRIDERGGWGTKTLASLAAPQILDVDFSTRTSLIDSAKRAAEQQARDTGHSMEASSTAAERVEKIVNRLSRFATGKGVTIKTRQGLTTFGQGLPDAEIRYLHSVVRRALAGDLRGA